MSGKSARSPVARGIARHLDELQAAASLHGKVRARLLAAPAPYEARSGRYLRPVLAAAAFSLAVGGALWTSSRWKEEALEAHFGETKVPLVPGAWVYAPPGRPSSVSFTDQTEVTLEPNSSAKLLALRSKGAELELGQGRARVYVVPQRGSAYQVSAGPYQVRVTGTRFDVAWNPTGDAFELALHEGQVELSGCVFGSSFSVTAGQRVRASCHNQKLEVGRIERVQASKGGPSAAAEPTVSTQDNAAAATIESQKPAATRPDRSAQEGPSWATLAREGERERAWARAEEQGLEKLLAGAPASDLLLLGDLARDMREVTKARRIYEAVRQRSGGRPAAFAAFALGRLEFDHAAAYLRAAGWFETYLKEEARGPFAREARGRLMEAFHKAKDGRAKRVAEEYVRLYPKGPHAELAARITRSNAAEP